MPVSYIDIYILILFLSSSPQVLRPCLGQLHTPCLRLSLCLNWPVRSLTSFLWWSLWSWPTQWPSPFSPHFTTLSSGLRSYPTSLSWAWDTTSEFGWTDGWVDGWVDRQICIYLPNLPFFLLLFLCRLQFFLPSLLLSPPSHLPLLSYLYLIPFSRHLYIRKYNIRVEDIMVRDVRYITLSSTYRDLQEVLLTGQLKTLALVESTGESEYMCYIWQEIMTATFSSWRNRWSVESRGGEWGEVVCKEERRSIEE